MVWHLLGSGSFNTVYINEDRTEVFKLRHALFDSDLPDRSVRLWNLINDHILPPAELRTIPGLGDGWVCPFIEGVAPTDQEIQHAVVDIFNKTGRVVVDATVEGNFIKTPSGQVVCVDIGCALQIESEEKDLHLGGLKREPSSESLHTWDRLSSDDGYCLLEEDEEEFPKAISTIKAILYIQQHRPDIAQVDFLKRDADLVKVLANAYLEPILARRSMREKRMQADVARFSGVIKALQTDSHATLISILGLLKPRSEPTPTAQSSKRSEALAALDSRVPRKASVVTV
ncbi:MAG: hypothetical protein P1U34_10895 [Coxiellaceae bacterium]|nr:hypothetical protein [Coxiellaceae bacterium]